METTVTDRAAGAGRCADTVHPDLTFERVLSAATEHEFAGFCTACGAETGGIEPDARQYRCDECGAERVYGAEQMVIENLFHRGAGPA